MKIGDYACESLCFSSTRGSLNKSNSLKTGIFNSSSLAFIEILHAYTIVDELWSINFDMAVVGNSSYDYFVSESLAGSKERCIFLS